MDPNLHLTDYLEKHALNTPHKPALVTSDKTLTWQELWQAVRAGAAHIGGQLDSEQQQIVALLMPNSWECVVAYLSVIHAGHMAMPIDVIFKPLEIKAVLNQVPPALLITDEAGTARVNDGAVNIIRADDFPTELPQKEVNYLRLPADRQIASLFFTSGTTGKPKVAPNTHTNHIWNIQTCTKVWNWTSEDSQLINVRLSHMLGLVMGLSGTLCHGNTMYLQDGFSAKDTLRMLASGKVTMFSHGPLVYSRLLEAAADKNYDLSNVRLFISGSGPLPPVVWKNFKKIFGAEILEVYGSTETGRITSNLLNERIPGSPGRPLPGVDLKFSHSGEVLVKSPGVFPGYFKNSAATKKSLTTDGYWRTGDKGELKKGRLVLHGRTQETIRRYSYTISPRDVEWALHEDPRIKEVLVMGINTTGEADDKLVYFVVGDINKDQVLEFSKINLPSVWRADQIILLDSLPRTRTGKPNLARLKAMLN